MKSIYDIQQYLKSFGSIMYIGDRVADLEMMESEVIELHRSQLMDNREFETAILLLRQEIGCLKKNSKITKKDIGEENGG